MSQVGLGGIILQLTGNPVFTNVEVLGWTGRSAAIGIRWSAIGTEFIGDHFGFDITAQGHIGNCFYNAFTSDGLTTFVLGNDFDSTLTLVSGNTLYATNVGIAGHGITTQTAAEVVGSISSLRIAEPQIVLGVGSSVTFASTLHIVNAPTEGVAINAAIFVEAGNCIYGAYSGFHSTFVPWAPISMYFDKNIEFGDNVTHYHMYKGIAGNCDQFFDDGWDNAAGKVFFRMRTHGVAVNVLTLVGSGFVGINKVAPGSELAVVGLPSYANNAAALVGGLTSGDFYCETGTDPLKLCIVA
jgi:hypothetical protein